MPHAACFVVEWKHSGSVVVAVSGAQAAALMPLRCSKWCPHRTLKRTGLRTGQASCAHWRVRNAQYPSAPEFHRLGQCPPTASCSPAASSASTQRSAAPSPSRNRARVTKKAKKNVTAQRMVPDWKPSIPMARDPQAHDCQCCLGSAVAGNVRLHDTGFGGAGTRLPPPPQPTRARPVRL
jgi:hypothetical protein